jgi:hypothetical protein
VTAVIAAKGLGKRYGRKFALTDCTLDIPSGHVVGLVGPMQPESRPCSTSPSDSSRRRWARSKCLVGARLKARCSWGESDS